MTQVRDGVAWRVERLLEEALAPGGMGWCFVLRTDGQERMALSSGWARAPWETTQPGVAVTPNTRFHLASMSKLVTNLGIRAVVDDWNGVLDVLQPGHPVPRFPQRPPSPGPPPPGPQPQYPPGATTHLVQRVEAAKTPIALDTPVLDLIGHRVTNPALGTGAITLWDLMSHQSGIDIDSVPWPDPFDLWAGVNLTFQHALAQAPGTGYPGYSNRHYIILRAVIEDVMGVDYETQCRQRVWEKAGVMDASCHNNDSAPTLYYGQISPHAGELEPALGLGASWPDYADQAGAYGWYASMRDVACLLEAARQGRILSASQTADFLSEAAEQSQPGSAAMHFTVGTSKGVGHNGGWTIDGGSVGGAAATFDNSFVGALVINSDPAVDATDLFSRTMASIVPAIEVAGDGSCSDPYLAPAVHVRNPYGFGDLRATTDGSPVSASSPAVTTDPLLFNTTPTTVTAAVFDGSLAATFSTARVVSTTPHNRPSAPVPSSESRWAWRMQQLQPGKFERIPPFGDPTSIAQSGTSATLDSNLGGATTNYALEFTGWFVAAKDGLHRFQLTSDDGGRLWIGDSLVCDNDGLHGPLEVEGTIALAAGAHPVRVEYVQAGGGSQLDVTVIEPGQRHPHPGPLDVRLPPTELPPAPEAVGGHPGIGWQMAQSTSDHAIWPTIDLPVIASGVSSGINLEQIAGVTNYAIWFDGWLNVQNTGPYDFTVTSDDGSWLRIGPVLLADSNAPQRSVSCSIALATGLHRIRVGFMQVGGDQNLSLTWSGPGLAGTVPLDDYLFRRGF